MKAIASVLFLCKVLIAYALECSQSPSFVPVSSSVQLSNQLPTPIQAIVPSLQFRCQSFITGGNIQAVGASNFDIQVWRPQDNVGNLYNLIWRREFQSRVSVGSSNMDTLVNSSFSMSPGVPVRPGDVIGFYSLESARFLYSFSQQGEIIYTRTSQGPLCNFSINTNAALERRMSALPLISLTYVNATNQEIQLVEQRLPLIGDSCTITTPLDGISTSSIPTSTVGTALSTTMPLLSTSDINGNREQATTLPIVSDNVSNTDGISGSSTTEDSSDDDQQFLSLSLMEFILLVVILAVTVIVVLIVIIVTCCCCLYVQRVRSQVEINNAEATVKEDEMHIPMNVNPVYEAVRSQTLGLTQTDYPPCIVNQSQRMSNQLPLVSYITGRDQSLMCTIESQTTSTCKTEGQCSSITGENRQYQDLVHLAPSDYHVASPIISDVDCIGKHQACESDRSVHKENLRTCPSNEYSYPNHGVQWIQGHQSQYYAADGYIIIQPDQYRLGARGNNNTETANIEKHGSRGDFGPHVMIS